MEDKKKEKVCNDVEESLKLPLPFSIFYFFIFYLNFW